MAETVWLLISAALVLFMVPGLALFYGGMVRRKNILNMLMMNIYCLGIVPLVWVLVAYSLASVGDGSLIGNLDAIGLKDVPDEALAGITFTMTFAVITPALISGGVADRLKFRAWAIFVPFWLLLVYSPVVFWVYSGWIHALPAHDFAGGTAIHVNAGVATLALVAVLGNRRGFPGATGRPHNLVLTMLGAGILWFGWFGFNAGGASDPAQAAQAFMSTFLAGAAGMIAWLAIEARVDGKPTSLGAASGLVAGLVAITPAVTFVGTLASILFGLLAGIACFYGTRLKVRVGFDDSLDVVGVHLVGGIVGGVLIGFLADANAGPDSDFLEGLLFGGGTELLFNQVVSIVVVMAYSFAVTYALSKVLDLTVGLRVDSEEESEGLDVSEHGEIGYVFT
ncbi:MAG: ammonium transporter [Actinomycetia bacterium]|nr:ammonium transporter [Actinomycetes bacterium]